MRSFVFFGRLVPEKGFHLLFPFFDAVIEKKCAKMAVFGDGELKTEFLSRFSGRADFFDFRLLADSQCALRFRNLRQGSVAYFGRRNFSAISETLPACDVSLMPSTFLETFGLSALESLSHGVPVAGFSKGGIVPFLLDEKLRLPESEGFVEALESLAEVPDSAIADWKRESTQIAAAYSRDAFRDRVKLLLPEGAVKILLVTDFTLNIGGIETYVVNLAATLADFGYEVRTVGKEGGFVTKFDKAFSTLAAFANFRSGNELRTVLKEFSPDVVWCHSVLRRYGARGIDPVFEIPAFRIMTYHDLGYFAPFAAACRTDSDVPRPGFFPFVRSAHGIARKAFAAMKYVKLRDIFARLSRFDLHLVPSDFMVPFVRERLPEGSSIVTLPHYVP
jgi:glycosyltransferase involved in cell wall biosynthesis